MQFKLDTQKIPKKVLLGKVAKFRSVAAIYKSIFTQELLKRVNASYWLRASGEADPVAGPWEPLSKNTIRHKKKLQQIDESIGDTGIIDDWYEEYDFGPSNTDYSAISVPAEDRRHSPNQHMEHDREKYIHHYTKKLAELKRDTTLSYSERRKAAEIYAQSFLPQNRDVANLINIRSGRLVAATAPGKVVGNRYYPPQDQTVNITFGNIHIDFKQVPYAESVDGMRPILPESMEVWIIEAHNIAIQAALHKYQIINAGVQAKKARSKKRAMLLKRTKAKRKKKKPRIQDPDVPF